jgi:MscS family membrane protein
MMEDFLQENLGDDATVVVMKLLLIAAILALTWLARQIISRIIPSVVSRMAARTRLIWDERIVTALLPPARFTVNVIGLWFAMVALELPAPVERSLNNVMRSLVGFALFWAIYRLIDPLSELLWTLSRRAMSDTPLPALLERKLSLAFKQMVRGIVAILGFAAVVEAWGFDIAGLIAGLGLGGLALALAAQNTLENLLGYFVILADEPFQVGESVVVNNIAGTVEAIGFRSTRIRALDQALIAVPNNSIANASVTNWSRLEKRRLNMTLGLAYNSAPDQVLSVVQAIREMLQDHEKVQPDSVIVQFSDFNATGSLDMILICFMNTPAWGDFQAAKQDINLKIMDILAERGVELAQPSRTILVEQAEPTARLPKPVPPPKPEPLAGTATDSPMPADAGN